MWKGGCWKPFVDRSRDLGWAAWLYMQSPEVKGSARCSDGPQPRFWFGLHVMRFSDVQFRVFFLFVIAGQIFLLDPIKVN